MRNIYTRKVIVILIVLQCIGCFNPDDYDTSPYSSKDIYFLSEDTTNIPADGTSSAEIIVKISEKSSPGKRVVVFKTTSGQFIGGSGDSIVVVSMEDLKASARLTNLNAGTSKVTAKIQGIQNKDSISVSFLRAYPDTIISVKVDSFAVAGYYKGEIVISAALKSNNGKPSLNHPVYFDVKKPDGESIGDFLNDKQVALTDINGIARIRYSPGTTNYEGFVNIRAVTAIKENAGAKDSTQSQTRIYILK